MVGLDYFPRFQEIVVPLLRDAVPDGVTVTSWIPDIDYRSYPVVNVRRLGGFRSLTNPDGMDKPVIEMTVIHDEGLEEAEALYNMCLDALLDAQKTQTVYGRGHITKVRETMGMTQFSSLFQDTFRVQGLIQLHVKPNREEP